MKHIIAILFILAAVATGQERYSQIRIPLTPDVSIERIAQLGFPLEEAAVKPGAWIELFASGDDLRVLREQRIAYTAIIEDWDAHYTERLRRDTPPMQKASVANRVEHFHLGSMGGHLTLDELFEELDAMRAFAPGLISANDTVGVTQEGRPIVAVRICASADTGLPAVLYTGLHHAREPESMMQLVYFMWYLLEQRGRNPEITKLLDRAALHFIPVVNPDGYAYNEATKPGGGGMWRKNRTRFGTAAGVDLNRNYGYKWGFDNTGSSPDSTRETFRGHGPFSELETQAVARYCDAHRFRYALNYHTFSSLMIFPWGYSDKDTEDSLAFRALAERLTVVNRYTWGTGRQTVNYVSNGSSDDWMYGDTAAHARIFSMTPEIGNGVDGFWALPSRIVPLAEENLEQNLQLAHMVVPHARILWSSVSEDAGGVDVSIAFTGADTLSLIDTVRVACASPGITLPVWTFTRVPMLPATPLRVRLEKNSQWLVPGERVRLDVVTVTPESVMRDSVLFRPSAPLTLFADGAEAVIPAWIFEGQWGRVPCEKARGGYCYSESPAGSYRNDESSSMTLRQPLDLRAYTAAELRFETRWHIESNSDYGTVEVSGDDGDVWIPLEGRYTSRAFGKQKQVPVDIPGYDGKRSTWAAESMDLTPWCGLDNIRLRFNFESDEGAVFDGWLVDSISITGYQRAISDVDGDGSLEGFALSEASPNPCRDAATFRYTLPVASAVSVTVSDALGRVRSVRAWPELGAGQHRATVLAGLPAGVYFVRLEAGRAVAVRRVVKIE